MMRRRTGKGEALIVFTTPKQCDVLESIFATAFVPTPMPGQAEPLSLSWAIPEWLSEMRHASLINFFWRHNGANRQL